MKKCNVIMRHFSVVALAMIISLSLTSVTSIAASKKMTLNKSSATLKLGSTLQLKASNAGSTVKWSSDNKKVATVKDGLVTAKGVGVTQIKAVSNKVTVSCKITVYKPADKVTLKADLDYIEIGDIFEVNAIFSPKNATYQDLTWSVTSDDYWYPAIIQISDNRFEAQFDGTATIIAYQKETNKTYKLKLEVKEELGSFHIEYNF